jgi:hypothetical protein
MDALVCIHTSAPSICCCPCVCGSVSLLCRARTCPHYWQKRVLIIVCCYRYYHAFQKVIANKQNADSTTEQSAATCPPSMLIANPHYAATHHVIRVEMLNKCLQRAYGKSLDIQRSVPPSFFVPVSTLAALLNPLTFSR